MKKNTIKIAFCLLLAACCFHFTNAQPWIEFLPKNKSTEQLTLKDYQQAFNTYLEVSNVDIKFIKENKQIEGGWEKFKRWEYYMEGVVDADGHFPKQTGMQVVREHKRTNPEVYANTPKSSDWSSLGPFNSGGGYAGIGRINCIAFHPTNNNIWWVGAASGGLWVTTNNGASWECLTDDNGVLAVSDIIIPTDYATSQTIYIATGDRDAGDNSSIGVLKSTDNGVTWMETGLTYTINQGRRVNRLLLDPNNNNTILAATSQGVYKTTDGGTTWSTQLSNQNFIDMEYKPGNFNTLYGSRGAGIWRSIDGGANWEQVVTLNQQRAELAVTPANPEVVYALVSNNSSGLHGVYKSTNSGATFEQTFSGSTLNLLGWSAYGNDNGGQGWYDLCIAVSPTSADIVLVGGVNTWRSTNGGYDWQCVNHWWGEAGIIAVHADKHALIYRNDDTLFEGNDGGIYTSPNDGTTWTDKTNGMRISQMYKLGCSATVSGDVITGLQDNGSKLFSGNNWQDVYGGDGMECLIDYSNVNIQYATIYYGKIFRTMNHWNSNVEVYPRDDGAWVTPYIIHPTNPQILYAGYTDIYKTENRGNTWTQISTVNTSNKLRNIAICDANPDVIYMADESRIWKTTNGGQNWTQLSLPGNSITSLCVKNDDPNTIWYTRGGYNALRVYKSINGGVNWENISAGLPNIPMYSIVSSKLEGQAEQLYVGSEVGVYYKDGDNEWVAYNNGLPNVKIGEIEIYYNLQNPEACRLRAATYGRGLWESPIIIQTEPIAGIINGPSQLCEYEVAQLFLIGAAGTIQWQKSLNGNDWSDIEGATSSSYQSEPLHESTYFRAKVTLVTTVFSDKHFVKVNPKPQTPIISRTENTLTSNADEGNQWHNQDGLIPGAVEKTFTPTENGTYFTIVTLDNCASEPSNTILVDNLSIGGHAVKDGNFKIFPNPVNEQLIINNEQLQIKRVILVNLLGKEVINIQQNNVTEAKINVAKISAGLYQIRIETDKGIYTAKIVKQ
ncbi:MAG: T9SS type A sorting domain-containing protein [Bacteroidetes bacterium]|nr:T9SS type A sorting domain-containing protein [Bacteroidota bacterium]MCL1969287.1 T9SS type A sorting domain-containing protein [Bacteroidota bacterium]